MHEKNLENALELFLIRKAQKLQKNSKNTLEDTKKTKMFLENIPTYDT